MLLFVRHWSQLFRCPPEQLFRSALKLLVDCALEFFQCSPQQLGILRAHSSSSSKLGIVLHGSQFIVRAPNSSSVHSSGAAVILRRSFELFRTHQPFQCPYSLPRLNQSRPESARFCILKRRHHLRVRAVQKDPRCETYGLPCRTAAQCPRFDNSWAYFYF
ncbi:hypothetical protein B0H14DRAFT_3511811 [Mycena olivaceomarginata]|nr:hypothetical protein B0H14DRAFT_3511811 [Mycena olivaceomarginata]